MVLVIRERPATGVLPALGPDLFIVNSRGYPELLAYRPNLLPTAGFLEEPSNSPQFWTAPFFV